MNAPLHSREAELGILGALFYLAHTHSFETARDTVLELRQKLPPDAFYFHGNRVVYERLHEQCEAGKAFDVTTLSQAILDSGLEEFGGEVGGMQYAEPVAFLTALVSNHGFTSGLLKEHVEIVHEKFIRRQIETVCNELLQKSREEQDSDIRQALDHAQSRMLAISEKASVEETFRLPKAGVIHAVQRLSDAYDNRGGISGMPSGLMDLDRMTTGWKPAQLIIVAGATAMGKTSLMLQWAADIVLRQKKPVAFFSLEMSYEELIERLVYAEARVSLQRARDGHMSEEAMERFRDATEKIARALLYVDDAPGLNVFEFRARARRAVKKFGCAAIFGDYLQLFEDTEEERDDNRVIALQRVSRGAKLAAKELKVPIFLGAQLNAKPDERKQSVVVNPYNIDPETRKPRTVMRYGVPRLNDLRECKAIAMDADLVAFAYRPFYYSQSEEDRVGKHVEWAQIIIGKQRNGPVGAVPVHFIDDETRFATIPDKDGRPRQTLYTTSQLQQQPGYEPKHGDKPEEGENG